MGRKLLNASREVSEGNDINYANVYNLPTQEYKIQHIQNVFLVEQLKAQVLLLLQAKLTS